MGDSMSGNASFIGNIPDEYDRGLGPMIFADYAADLARRVSALAPARVLEMAAGTGIVTRRLRDLLPESALWPSCSIRASASSKAERRFRH
jgi:hypothetical protein